MSNENNLKCATELTLTTSDAGLNTMKVMPYIRWDWKGIMYYELLPNKQSIDAEKYCSQIYKLHTAIQ